MALSNASRAGFAIFVGAVQFAILVVVSEIIDSTASSPHIFSTGNETGYTYSVASNYISDLGASCPPNGACYFPPSAVLKRAYAEFGFGSIIEREKLAGPAGPAPGQVLNLDFISFENWNNS